MKRQTYTPGIEECAVRIPIEAFGDYSSIWSAIQAIASKIGYTPETLRSWHKKHIDQTISVSKSLNAKIESSSKAAGIEAQAETSRPAK